MFDVEWFERNGQLMLWGGGVLALFVLTSIWTSAKHAPISNGWLPSEIQAILASALFAICLLIYVLPITFTLLVGAQNATLSYTVTNMQRSSKGCRYVLHVEGIPSALPGICVSSDRYSRTRIGSLIVIEGTVSPIGVYYRSK
ncbi:hypothetical protein [Yoonia sp. BS5-3]|uniref:Uncharacterized protein n=1 Tax=Yoonia phaeophyticola TaxID=3137369 RepID=A0ABZ2V9U0_9RHOB